MKKNSLDGIQTQKHRTNLIYILLFYMFTVGLLLLSSFYIFYVFSLEISSSILLYILFSIPPLFIIYRLMSGPPTYYHGWKKIDFQYYFIILFIMYLSFLVLLELEINVTNYGIYIHLASLLGILIYLFIFLFFADGAIKIRNHVYFYQGNMDVFEKLKKLLEKNNLDYVIEEKDNRFFSHSNKIKLFVPSKNLRINFSPKGITLMSRSITKDVKNLMSLTQKYRLKKLSDKYEDIQNIE